VKNAPHTSQSFLTPQLTPTATTSASTHTQSAINTQNTTDTAPSSTHQDTLTHSLAHQSLEDLIELKFEQFFQQVAGFYPEKLHQVMMRKMEKPLIRKVLERTGGNQVQAAKILGINRLTLSKKIKFYGLDINGFC